MTKNSHENDGAVSHPLQSSPATAASVARTPLLTKSSDKDKLLRRSAAELNSATPEASRSSSNISIRFSKKAAEDSEDESEAVLAIKMSPPAVPVTSTTDAQLNDTV